MQTIVDTTVFTDVLLKSDTQRTKAKAALAASSETLLPAYAVKEFKQGPLHSYVWFHNKVVVAGSWPEAINAIRSNLGYRRYLPATALQALQDFFGSIAQQLPADITQRYPGMTVEQAQLSELQIWLKQRIMRAWLKRRKVATVINPLSCYVEAEIETKASGQLDDKPTACNVPDCCLRQRYNGNLEAVKKLQQACIGTKNEVVKRRQALDRLISHPTKPYEEKHCRALGDAVFALECPAGGEILTTNIVDHEPLAAALNLTVRAP